MERRVLVQDITDPASEGGAPSRSLSSSPSSSSGPGRPADAAPAGMRGSSLGIGEGLPLGHSLRMLKPNKKADDALKSLRAGALPGSTSNLLSRLQSFLPQLADANAQLAAKIAQEGQAAVDIEAVDEAEGRYIAMNVALAPLARGEGSSSDDDDSDAEDDSDSSEDEGGAAAASSSSSSGGGAGGRSGAAMSDEDGGITHLRASRGGVSKPSLPGIEGITPADALLLLGMVPGVAAAEAPSSDEGSDSSDSDEGMGGPSSGARRSGRRGGGGRSGRGGARHGKKRGRR